MHTFGLISLRLIFSVCSARGLWIQIWDTLHDLVPFVRFKKRENTHRRVLLLLKITLLHGCFSWILNNTNGAKSRKASHIRFLSVYPSAALECHRNVLQHRAAIIAGYKLAKFLEFRWLENWFYIGNSSYFYPLLMIVLQARHIKVFLCKLNFIFKASNSTELHQ